MLLLLMELSIIRLLGAYLPVLGYFKNFSLLSCFLGMGIGFSTSAGERGAKIWTIGANFALTLVIAAMVSASDAGSRLSGPVGEMLLQGFQAVSLSSQLLSGLMILSLFLFNALTFIPVGEMCADFMRREPSTNVAYGVNLVGSVSGIGVFSLINAFSLDASVWIIAIALCLLSLSCCSRTTFGINAISLLAAGIVVSTPPLPGKQSFFSPYQYLTFEQSNVNVPVITTNGLYFQKILNFTQTPESGTWLARAQAYYDFPYSLNHPQKVLVVGSGSGNDVAAALRASAARIDAVEIDPVILDIGSRIHPERPYQSERVSVYQTDARRFFRATQEHYDVIVFGLLDSHVTVASKSGGVRLDSYVYTVEAFKAARARLAPNGILVLSFTKMGGAISAKLYEMLRLAFDGEAPLVFDTEYDEALTFVAGKGVASRFASLESSFAQVGNSLVSSASQAVPATDDWPFLYMTQRQYPLSYLVFMMAILAVSAFLTSLRCGQGMHFFRATPFFLGAGFMLLETKAITELTLFFGSIFSVVSIVILSILILGYLANLMVSRNHCALSRVAYPLLLASIPLSYAMTFLSVGELPFMLESVLRPLVLTLPVFFGGICFANEVRRSHDIAPVMASNVFGALLGGTLEHLSLYVGFGALYGVIFMLYGLACVSSARARI